MVSDFIQKNTTILRILLIITSLIYYVSSTLHASDVKVLLNKTYISLNLDKVKPKPKTPIDILGHKPGPKKNIRIVLDAGHGGHDSGAIGKNAFEKDLSLKMAIKTGEMIEKRFPDVEVFQTRTTDVFIPLFSRIQYANELNADIFISIHCNYISNSKTRGTETFVMGINRAEGNLEVAKRENASILLESNYESNYDGFDPNSAEGHIVVSMYQNNYVDKSIEFAANVESEFSKKHMSKSRGVKQAGFAVLRRSSMPAVLVEAGFLSNEVEEAFLMSEEGQNAIAESIVKAFEIYYTNNNLSQKQSELAKIDNTSKNDKTSSERQNSKAGEENNSSKQDVSKSKQMIKDDTNGSIVNSKTSVQSKDYNIQKFKVQIAALKNEFVDLDSADLRKIGSLTVKRQDEINKYLVGDFVSRESAEIAREKLKNLGYKGAFIVPIIE
ncbi:MAG: N-acetylmuramoyl-L-alanine amidase [Saprospiraceae bacterium]|nr:N-acetylmuramoyl-L-alanine amidase [Saprospiraceae bacterium]